MTKSKNLRRSDCTQSMYILPFVALMLMLLFVCTSPANCANGNFYVNGDTTVRLVESMPKWIPGEKNGVPVNVKCRLRIDFILNK